MYNPLMNPKAGQERLNEMLKEAEQDRLTRKLREQNGDRSTANNVQSLIVKTLSAIIR